MAGPLSCSSVRPLGPCGCLEAKGHAPSSCRLRRAPRGPPLPSEPPPLPLPAPSSRWVGLDCPPPSRLPPPGARAMQIVVAVNHVKMSQLPYRYERNLMMKPCGSQCWGSPLLAHQLSGVLWACQFSRRGLEVSWSWRLVSQHRG